MRGERVRGVRGEGAAPVRCDWPGKYCSWNRYHMVFPEEDQIVGKEAITKVYVITIVNSVEYGQDFPPTHSILV